MGTIILGIGNVLLKDEGVGCHVAHALEEILLPNTKVIDGGTSPNILLPEDTDKLIVVDAAKGGGMPGEVYRFSLDDMALEQKSFLSLHDIGLIDNLLLMRLLHNTGETIIIGVEPKEIEWGLELSPELQERIPQIVESILAELNTPPNLSLEGEE
jgi:hydrogenase maturation protease